VDFYHILAKIGKRLALCSATRLTHEPRKLCTQPLACFTQACHTALMAYKCVPSTIIIEERQLFRSSNSFFYWTFLGFLGAFGLDDADLDEIRQMAEIGM
jgi:hypothetical protein